MYTYNLDPDRTDYYDLKNSSAGTWHFTAEASSMDGDFYDLQDSAPFKVKRYARLASTQASPEPVVKGHTLTVTGTLTRANWDTNAYAGYSGQSVALQFKKSGSSTYTTVKTVSTDSSGKLRTTVTANATGTWRWKFMQHRYHQRRDRLRRQRHGALDRPSGGAVPEPAGFAPGPALVASRPSRRARRAPS